jgi:hypothetical protein
MSALWTVDLYLLPSTVRSLRLAVQDAALSRRKHEFDSRREHHYLSITYGIYAFTQLPYMVLGWCKELDLRPYSMPESFKTVNLHPKVHH